MSNALNLYYLNQMGITPWVYKNKTIKSVECAKILICTTATSFNPQYKKMLEHIIFFLNCSPAELEIRELESSTQIISTYSPYIVTFGVTKNNLDCLNPASYLVEINSLEYWLQYPLAKKQLFVMLDLFKNKLD